MRRRLGSRFVHSVTRPCPCSSSSLCPSWPHSSLLSITNAVDQIGEPAAASLVHPAVQDFKKFSLEFLGDTGAAHDIGSLRALADQGVDRAVLEPWIRALDDPVRFSTGGGPQL